MATTSVPQEELQKAKEQAVAQFLHPDNFRAAVSFAARSSPRLNVVGVGIGPKIIKGKVTSQTCVRFYVGQKHADSLVPKANLLPARIGKVPTDIIETGWFRAFAKSIGPRGYMRPAHPGASVGFEYTGADAGTVMAGTFGALVEADGKRYILSNNHVLANENALPLGSTIFQPGLLDRNTPAKNKIGKLARFIKLKTAGSNQVDCAIAELSAAAAADAIVLHKVGKLSSGVPLKANENMKVEKTGRTTGYTTGVIRDVQATVKVTYDSGTLTFADQIVIVNAGGSSFSDAGDSGSLIVERTTKQPVGLLFGGTKSHTLANHIEDVLSALNVAIVA